MCHFRVIKYTGCGCELKFVISCCSQGDGTGNCSGVSAYERNIRAGICGRSNCSYYESQRTNGRWSFENSGTTTIDYPMYSNIDSLHPKAPAPSPRPFPDFPAPNSPNPHLYDTRDCCTSYPLNPYSITKDYADCDIQPEFE